MSVRSTGADSRGWVVPLALSLLLTVAYAPLLTSIAAGLSGDLMFRIGALPPLLVLGTFTWLLWQRFPSSTQRDRSAVPAAGPSNSRALSFGLGTLAILMLVWSHAVGKTDLLYVSLSLAILTIVGEMGGATAQSRALAPASVLLLGVAVPFRIESEVIWRMQLLSAEGAHRVLLTLGREFKRAGVILRDGEHTFHVIDTCSGWTGALTLVLVAAVIRELLGLSRKASTLLFLATPVVAITVNVLRVAWVAGSPEPEKLAGPGADHTLQGVLVLMLGTAILYGLGMAIDRLAPTRAASSIGTREQTSGASTSALGMSVSTLRSPEYALALSALLAALSLLLPSGWWARDAPPAPRDFTLPAAAAGWAGERTPPEYFFSGRHAASFERRYTRRGERTPLPLIDVFIGEGVAAGEFPARSFSSKRLHPGPDWNLLSHERKRVWSLGRIVDVVVAAPTAEQHHVVMYAWIKNDPGLLVGSIREWIGLDRLRSHAPVEPVLVKLIAHAPHGGELSLDRARQRIDRFVSDFGPSIRPLLDAE